jgi:hypothetical protein
MLNIVLAALPILGKLIPEGKAGDIIAAGSKVAQEVFGTTSESEIAAKIATDPTLAERFKAKLEAETEALQANFADVQNARQQTIALATQGSNIAWAPVLVSLLVVLLFGAMGAGLMFRQVPDSQISIVVFTTLSTGFGMVLQYWLGSSAGSARSGDTIRYIAQQAATPTPGQVLGRMAGAAITEAAKR